MLLPGENVLAGREELPNPDDWRENEPVLLTCLEVEELLTLGVSLVTVVRVLLSREILPLLIDDEPTRSLWLWFCILTLSKLLF